MRIESLQYIKKRGRGVVEMTLDTGTTLSLDADLVVQFRLSRGMELSEHQFQEIQNAENNLQARRRLIRYLALRRKTERESIDYLRRLSFPETAIQLAIAAAKELGYLNDESYAAAYTSSQSRIAAKGPRALEFELRAKGVARDIAQKAVQPLAEPDVQLEAACALVLRKSTNLASDPEPKKAKQRIYQYLLRKGFDGDIALQAIRSTLGDLDTENS